MSPVATWLLVLTALALGTALGVWIATQLAAGPRSFHEHERQRRIREWATSPDGEQIPDRYWAGYIHVERGPYDQEAE